MRMGDNRMNTAIDMSGLGLDKIEESDEEFKIGCMTTLRQLEVHEGFNEPDGCSKNLASPPTSVQFRITQLLVEAYMEDMDFLMCFF